MLNLSFMPPSSPDAEALGKAYFLFHENITKVCTFREVAIAGREAGVVASKEKFIKETLPLFMSQTGQLPKEEPSSIESLIFDRTRNDASASSDAACLILAHSVFEALVHDLMDILPSARSASVIKNIIDRKLRIGDLEGANLEILLAAEARRYVSELKRESLKKKLAFIFDCCGFAKSCQKPGYTFDQNQLVAIDKERQEIIHHSIFGQPLLGIESKLTFLTNTGDFLVCVVSRATCLEVNVRFVLSPFMSEIKEESIAYAAVASMARTVDAAMKHWAFHVTAGHSTQEQKDKVRVEYEAYQEAFKTVFAVQAELKANNPIDYTALNNAVVKADKLARTLVLLIESKFPAGEATDV
jgi:hypothetical protein